MKNQIRGASFGLLALLCALPAWSADIEVETLVEGSQFRAGSITMTMADYQAPCGQAARAAVFLEHDNKDLSASGLDGLQSEIRALATAVEASCTDFESVRLKKKTPEGEEIYETILESENWQLQSTKQSREDSSAWRDSVQKAIANFTALPANPDNGLKNYGYHKAVLVGETPKFSLYQTLDKAQFGKYSLAILHKVQSDSEPAFDARDNGQQGGQRTGPIFTEALENIIKEADLRVFPFEQINHYFAGYHNPNADRVKVMSPNFAETPHFITQLPTYWENGELFLSPYGSPAYNVRFFTRGDIIAAWGASAAVEIDDPLALPDFGDLPPEKPGAEYMARQAAIRQAAMDKGLIYKNDAYWSEFSAYETRKIFEAYAEYESVNSIAFGAILMGYLRTNSEQCQSTIQNPVAFKLDEVTTETDKWGYSTTSTSNIYDIVVPGRFQAELEERFNTPDDPDAGLQAMQMAFGAMQPGGLRQMAKELAQTKDLIERSVADVQRIMSYGACGNPVQQQLEEMLFHLSNGIAPSDASQLSFDNARAFSDPLYTPGNAPSLQGACVIDSEFGGRGNRRIRWCECVVDKVPQVKPNKIAEYVKRYEVYKRDVAIAKLRTERGQENPDNRLYSIQRFCAGQVD